MISNQNIICISSIDWDSAWQGHQEIMSTFAKNGCKILFIENTGVRPPGIKDTGRIKKRIANWLRGIKGIRKEAENIYVFSPLVLPFPYSHIARRINKYLILSILCRWMNVINFSEPIIWVFLPTGIGLDIIDNIVNKKLVIYYCIDDFAATSPYAKRVRKTEVKLIKKSDLVFVTSSKLFDFCAKYRKNVYTFPFGVNFDIFEQTRLSSGAIPEDISHIRTPRVGYVGYVKRWVDQELMFDLAKNNPEYSFVFVGPVEIDVSKMSRLSNVHFLGQKLHEQIPAYIKAFDCCIIPYLITECTNSIYPAKLNEYLAMGKPVVATKLPEIEAFNRENDNVVYVAKDAREFAEHIKKSIKEDSDYFKIRRIKAAKNNSWHSRIEEMSRLIEAGIKSRQDDIERKWKDNLAYFYRITRRRLAALSLVCIFVYLFIFETPFIWLVASPLKVSDLPQKTDAIVVFAGGVGESGKAGQGYEERVEYAVALYNQGYSTHILFSSGAAYALQETEIMQALALSMGVPGSAIFLENRSMSTYQNVKYTKEILDNKGWHSIMLVSSPYNMRRASLVFKKIGSGVKVIYAPIPHSIFYNRIDGVKLKQVKAILHEYAGIVYYWLKGYI